MSSTLSIMAHFLLALCLLLAACTPAARPIHTASPVTHWVIGIPGLFDDPSRFDRLAHSLEGSGYRFHSIPLREKNGSVSLRDLARDLQRDIHSRTRPGDSIHLVGFSMGGLIARSYLQELQPHPRIESLITVGTPHTGTIAARLSGQPGIQDMRPGSEFLTALNTRTISRLDSIRCLSIWTNRDFVIIPSRNAILPGKPEQEVPVTSHGFLMDSASVLSLITQELGRGTPPRP